MDAAWVLAAGAAAWIAIGLYLFLLSRLQADLSRRIRRMEREGEEE
ncbi:MAG: CcmD family protein [Desulfovibrio sp.]|jgi:CcmD family protein|nr:CcmD family protein [Desulfovibrio sp.]